MFNFHVTVIYPWLFLLLIPAAAVALIPYFRSAKKYRRNRNRITSMVLYFIVMFLSITVLAGVNFEYDVYNSDNEIMLLVDASYSTEEDKELKDDYVKGILSMVNTKVFKVGVITFGFDQQYVLPLTTDLSDAYAKYISAPVPDTTATDIAAALTYADSLLEKPESSKIILISDGVETDEKAQAVIKTIASRGVRVDAICCSSLNPETEVQVTEAIFPDYNFGAGDEITATIGLQSNYHSSRQVNVKMTDNGEDSAETTVDLTSGSVQVPVNCTFKEDGLHIINFTVSTENDTVVENNSFYTYVYIVPHDSVLIIENFADESTDLYNLLKESFKPTVVTIGDPEFPTTIDELSEYDEIILNNVASGDLTDEFINVLNEYVTVVGGGLFTVGGSEPGKQEIAHAYDRNDMAGSRLQEMLPVEAVNYTPPIAVVIVIDVSGSMAQPVKNSDGSQSEKTRLDLAKQAADSVVRNGEVLSTRDYCGVLKLEDNYDVVTRIRPMTEAVDIIQAIGEIGGSGGTSFAPSLDRASQDLRALYYNGVVQKMHVVVITDGAAADFEEYKSVIQTYRPEDEAKVTYSFLAIEADDRSMKQLEEAAELGGGRAYQSVMGSVTQDLTSDICLPEIRSVEYGEFIPLLDKNSSYAKIISQEDMPALYGFYGTRAKQSADVVLSGEYGVPIYAERRFGAGTVGSFMCDLKMSDWSSDFMTSETGKNFIFAVIRKLFPVGDIRAKELTVNLREDNYTTQISIYPNASKQFAENETVKVSVINLLKQDAEVQLIQPSAADGYSRASFVAKQPGVYEIKVTVMVDEAIKYECTLYKNFSYSKEYEVFGDDGSELMSFISENAEGIKEDIKTTDKYKAFEGFVTSIGKVFDPRWVFIIIALVLFLADVAVRKFKFKWPHELIKAAIEKRKSK